MAAIELASTSLFGDGNLASYYKMENTSDSKGSITLTNNNTATFVAAKFNNGGSLGASNTNKFFSNNTNNPFGIGSGAFTISFWIKVLSEPSGATYALFDTQSTTTQVSVQILYSDTAGTKKIHLGRLKNGTADQNTEPTVTALGTSTIHHIAGTYDTSNLNLYLDGALIGGPVAASGNGSFGATAGVTMGVNRNDSASNPASVIYDDVAVFTRALSAAEISTLYNGPITSTPSGSFSFL